MPFSAHYSAGKAAFSALLAGLAMELKPFHIQVIDLRPGDIKTAFNDELPRTMPPTSAYLPWTQTAWRESVRLMQEAPPPELIARGMVKLLRQKNPPAVARLGTFFQAKLGPLGVRFLPHRWLRESIRSYYRLNKVDEEQRDRD
jgi:NAD(P)-dependent dehydrogenase (short-subunit alcohol dehydrogenase family)